ncbi:MAG: N-acyl homoserine lactonase family protein [Pararhodobacter sp.]|nr:N-acyl homoserine lactonase family protein [Pararhodobacter sp.]
MSGTLLKGRPASLHILDYGLFRVHANGRIIGICGYLITTDAGERVLVDSGFPAKYVRDAAAASAEDRLGEFGEVLALTADNLPDVQLALCGVLPDQINLMIQTHTHIDHIGGLADFAQAPMVIAAAERALPRPLYWSAVQPLEWPQREYVVLDGDRQIGPGLEVLLAPGHAPGQLAVMLDLPETGPVLLTSDAISRPAEIDEAFATASDPTTAIASADRLLALADRRGAFVVYGHCPRQWPNLRKAPEAYR